MFRHEANAERNANFATIVDVNSKHIMILWYLEFSRTLFIASVRNPY